VTQHLLDGFSTPHSFILLSLSPLYAQLLAAKDSYFELPLLLFEEFHSHCLLVQYFEIISQKNYL